MVSILSCASWLLLCTKKRKENKIKNRGTVLCKEFVNLGLANNVMVSKGKIVTCV